MVELKKRGSRDGAVVRFPDSACVMWVESVGSLNCTARFFYGYSGFP